MAKESGTAPSNVSAASNNWKIYTASAVFFVAVLIIVVNVIGYLIGQRVGATNVPIEAFFVSAIVLFAFSFPLLRSYLEKQALDKLSESDFDKQVSKINLAEDSPLAAQGTYRFTLAIVVALILATGMFILATASISNTTITNLIQTILAVLTGGFTSIVAFYYGTRAAESGAGNAKLTTPKTPGETLLATLETLCGLVQVADRESIMNGLAEEYRKLTPTDKVAVQDGLQKSEKCKNKKEIIELFKKAIDVPASSPEKLTPKNGVDNSKKYDAKTGSWCHSCVHLAKVFCKEIRKHYQ
jgi:hypothetical protein